MSAILSLMYVQSLFQLGAKVGKLEGYYGEQTYLDMSFIKTPQSVKSEALVRKAFANYGLRIMPDYEELSILETLTTFSSVSITLRFTGGGGGGGAFRTFEYLFSVSKFRKLY